jgi:two-component system chemotaxis response regulator CheB
MAHTQTSPAADISAGHDIIVLGASAGGVEALSELISRLPADLPAAVFIVLHVPAYGGSIMPSILTRRGPLPAVHPKDGEDIRLGHVYVAPPDHHLILEIGKVRLTHGTAENGHRPAVDTLFRSAARTYGPRVLGVILSGTLDDGTAGLQAIKLRGGITLVQDPEEALFAGMPNSAKENVAVDYIQSVAGLAKTLVRLVHEPVAAQGTPMPPSGSPDENSKDAIDTKVKVAELDMEAVETPCVGKPSAFSCPACHGVLWEVEDGELVRFRCRVGHAFSPESLLASQSDYLEKAFCVALRALEESGALADRLRDWASERGHSLASSRFDEQANDARRRAEIIRQALTGGQIAAPSSINSEESSVL